MANGQHVDDDSRLHELAASNIRRLAERRGILLTHLPDRAGVSRAHFWKFMNGSHSASLRWLGKIARALEVTTDELLRPQEHPPGSKRR